MSVLSSAIERLGRRGVILMILGLVWVLTGVGIVANPVVREAGVFIPHENLLPDMFRAAAWGLSGLVAVWAALRRRCDDTPGYIAIMVMPLERTFSYLVAYLIYVISGWLEPHVDSITQTGYERGWIAAGTWFAVVTLVHIVAGWRESPSNFPMPPTANEDGDRHRE